MTHCNHKDRLKVNEWKRIYFVNSKHKKSGIIIATLEKIDFKTQFTHDMHSRTIHQEDIAIISVHVPNNSFKISKAKIYRTKERSRQFYNYSCDFNISLSNWQKT